MDSPSLNFPTYPKIGEEWRDNTVLNVWWVCIDNTINDVRWARKSSKFDSYVIERVLQPGEAGVIDGIDTHVNRGVKWIYTITDDITFDSYTAEIIANAQLGIPSFTPPIPMDILPKFANWNVYAELGPEIPHLLDVKTSGPVLQFSVTNTLPNTMTVNVRRFKISM